MEARLHREEFEKGSDEEESRAGKWNTGRPEADGGESRSGRGARFSGELRQKDDDDTKQERYAGERDAQGNPRVPEQVPPIVGRQMNIVGFGQHDTVARSIGHLHAGKNGRRTGPEGSEQNKGEFVDLHRVIGLTLEMSRPA
jgi:hypothetical protein